MKYKWMLMNNAKKTKCPHCGSDKYFVPKIKNANELFEHNNNYNFKELMRSYYFWKKAKKKFNFLINK